MNAMLIQIVKGHEAPEKRVFKNKETGDERVTWSQKAYMHNGGAFPQEFKIEHKELSDVLEVGDYNISPESYQANKYGKLELNPFELRLVKVS
jgi:hypothetical protein